MANTKKLWLILTLVMITSFGALGLLGREIHVKAPPVPERVVSEDGTVLFTRPDIDTGRQAWQSAGGMQLGSIWGHGAYLAPICATSAHLHFSRLDIDIELRPS